MKAFHLKFLFIFFISLVFCSEDEKYTFIFGGSQRLEVGEKWTYKVTHELQFNIPHIGLTKYATQHISITEYLGIDGEFYKFKETLTDMKSDNYVNNIEIMDYYREAMENNPCYLYVKGPGGGAFAGGVDYIDPVDPGNDHLQEAYEAAYMNIYPVNYRYPFGSGGVNVDVGDKWVWDYHKSKFYVNMGSPPSQSLSKTSWTLKKVKEKRAGKIAIIKMQDSLILELQVAVDFLGERRLMTGQATGVSDVTYRWDIDSAELLKTYAVTNLDGDFEMADEKFNMKIFMRDISKQVK